MKRAGCGFVFFFFFCLLFEQNFGYVTILYKNESCKLNSCEWFLDIPVHFLNERISVMGLHSVGTETSRYSQVFRALTGCQHDPRVLRCHYAHVFHKLFHQLLGHVAEDYVIHLDLDDNDFPLAPSNEEITNFSPRAYTPFKTYPIILSFKL